MGLLFVFPFLAFIPFLDFLGRGAAANESRARDSLGIHNMKKQLKLAVKNRDGIGRGPARRLRKSGQIPAIIYGKSGSKSVSVDAIAFRTLMRSKGDSASLVELALEDGGKELSIIKDFQRDPLSTAIIHIDLLAVDPNVEMTVSVPIHYSGEPIGVKTANGLLDIILHDVDVRCLPKDLPEFIAVDVSELQVNESIHVGKLPKLEGVTYPGDENRVVALCSAPEDAAADDEASAEAGAATSATAAAPAAAAQK